MSVKSRIKGGIRLFQPRSSQESSSFETLVSLPSLIFVVTMFGFPIIYLVYLSMTANSFSVVNDTEFIWFQNYIDVLSNQQFWAFFGNTIFYGVVSIGLGFPIQLGIALMLNADLPYQRVWQTLIILPWAVPHVITAMLWKLMFNPNFGVINWMLEGIGLISGPVNWFGGKWAAFSTIIVTDIWIQTPLVVLILLSGLQTIPENQYEAALMDGASMWDRFVHVTIPMLRPAIITVLVLRIIIAMRAFDLIYAITGGGPGNATTVIGIDVWENLMKFGNAGYSAAEAVILVLLIYGLLALAVYLFPASRSETRNDMEAN